MIKLKSRSSILKTFFLWMLAYLLFLGRVLFLFVVVEWIAFVGVVEGPFNEVVCQVKSTIIVGTVFEIDDYQLWIVVC